MKKPTRFLNNANELLSKSHIDNDTYLDIKPVREAFGTAYLAVLEAINEALLKKSLSKKQLPKSVEEYRKALRKHNAILNGRLLVEFEKLYDGLHIAGYYRELIYDVNGVKEYFRAAKKFIEKMSF